MALRPGTQLPVTASTIGAGKAGVATVGCTFGYGSLEELKDADYLVDAFAELLDLPLFR
jgi:phosphoglycolate phosphatase-like HAD superfamily hydrolase